MQVLRRPVAALLILSGMLVVLAGVTGVMAGEEAALSIAEVLLGTGCGVVCGWLLWRGDNRRKVAAAGLSSLGAFTIVAGLGEVTAARVPMVNFLTTELRIGVPVLLGGWLLWRGSAPRLIMAGVIASWGFSYALQALAYASEPAVAASLIARGGVPGLVCSWLLWRGAGLRQIAAVLLFTWPASYLIYSLWRSDLPNAIGELTVGLPTMIVGWLLLTVVVQIWCVDHKSQARAS